MAMIGVTSCAVNKEKEMAKDSEPSSFQPKPLDDQWSKWLIGQWQGWAESDAGAGKCHMKVEFGLNGQFLIIKSESQTNEMAPEHKKYLKETLGASDEDIKRMQSSTFKELQVHTIDPQTGEVVGFLFDSLRCIAEGRGTWQGNKETMHWKWSGQGASSTRIIEKISDNKFTINHKYTLPDGGKMEDKIEMTRMK
jgi:hypothetical protein